MDKNKRLVRILISAPLLLLIPFIGMQFTTDINWSFSDFLVMGLLLAVLGFLLEIILRKVVKKNKRIALIALLLIMFLLIWAELAVGIFGSPFAGS